MHKTALAPRPIRAQAITAALLPGQHASSNRRRPIILSYRQTVGLVICQQCRQPRLLLSIATCDLKAAVTSIKTPKLVALILATYIRWSELGQQSRADKMGITS